MFRGSNFLSDPGHNTNRFCTIVSLNDDKNTLDSKMEDFSAFWNNNRKKKIHTRAFIWVTGHGVMFYDTIGTQIVHTTAGEFTEFEKWVAKMGKKFMMNLFAGFDCCRVKKTLEEMKIPKGDPVE